MNQFIDMTNISTRVDKLYSNQQQLIWYECDKKDSRSGCWGDTSTSTHYVVENLGIPSMTHVEDTIFFDQYELSWPKVKIIKK